MRRATSVLDISSSKITGLIRYWDAKRGARPMPSWSDIDPAEIKPLLPHLMVTRYERNPFRTRYVIVGTWVVQYAGADFTGRYLDELDFKSEVETDWGELHRQVATEGIPIFGRCRFLSESGLERDYESAILPIADQTGSFVERGFCIEDFPRGAAVTPNADAIARAWSPAARPVTEPLAARSTPDLAPIGAADPEFRRCLDEAGLATVDLAGPGKHYFRLRDWKYNLCLWRV